MRGRRGGDWRGGEGIIIINMPRLFSYWSICIVFTAYLHTRYWIYISIYPSSKQNISTSIYLSFREGEKWFHWNNWNWLNWWRIFALLVFTPLSFNLIQYTVTYCSCTLSFLQDNEFLFLQIILKGQGQKTEVNRGDETSMLIQQRLKSICRLIR